MDSGRLTLVILASVLVGALIPLFAMLAIAAYRAGRAIAEVGARLKRTLAQVEIISDRVEVLSRGLQGGETNVADLMASVGTLARGLDRNMKAISVFSTLAASVGTAIAAYLGTRIPAGEAEQTPAPDGPGTPKGVPTSPAAESPGLSVDAR